MKESGAVTEVAKLCNDAEINGTGPEKLSKRNPLAMKDISVDKRLLSATIG